jgi:8-oxo-dGTP pyrophosphatase MutT (NUDIX family)
MDKEELVDLVDADGRIQRKAVPRSRSRDFISEGLYAQIILCVVWGPGATLLVQRRAAHADPYPGALDHVCGMVSTGEDSDVTAAREAHEETSVTLNHLSLVGEGLNCYGRYQYLYRGEATRPVGEITDDGVEWAAYLTEEEIRHKVRDGVPFCPGFFDDIEYTRWHARWGTS